MSEHDKESSGTTIFSGFQVSVISEDMIKEERKLEEEAELQYNLTMQEKYEPDTDERRFECFKKLMKHSEAYTEYLRNKMLTQVNLRRYERARKFFLMRSQKDKYVRKGIECEKFMVDTKINLDVADEKDPQRILEGNMLNINGDVVSMQQPFVLVNATLRPYQVDGLHWLKILYENGVNGILADEMGLGKTIQCISTIAHLLEMGIKGPFLVVAPLSTLSNWISEFQRFTPLITVILYHGSMEQRQLLRETIKPVKFLDLEVLPVILTSYEIVIKDHSFLGKFSWKYLVIDEGHRIKNFNCRLVKVLKRFNTSNKLLLTGTPLQNNMSELWSLMNFTIPEVFGDLESFEMWFNPDEILDRVQCTNILVQEQKQQVLQTMHRILRPFLLRRVKSEVEIDLPPKKEVLVYAPLTKLQESYYTTTLDKTIHSMFTFEEEEVYQPSPKKQFRFDENVSPGHSSELSNGLTTTKEESPKRKSNRLKSIANPTKINIKYDPYLGSTNIKLNNPTMQLRKIVNHPYLIHYPIDPATDQYKIDEDLVKNCGKLLVMDAILSKLKEHGHKVLVFSQMTLLMDILEDYLNLRNYSYVRLDGMMNIDERKEAIKNFTEEDTFVFLLSTRAGGLGINLTAADTVIIYDSDWNPQCDLQAMDRCHRIGQNKPVVVYRLVTAATIDEQIFKRAAAKKKLEKLVIQTGKFKEKKEKVNGISIQELKELLASNDYDVRMQPNGFVFSDEELASLMDRNKLFQQLKDIISKPLSIKEENVHVKEEETTDNDKKPIRDVKRKKDGKKESKKLYTVL